jgi:hypothetical protein
MLDLGDLGRNERPDMLAWRMLRMVPVWTWDAGEREIDLDARPEALVPVLETILEGGLWNQFRKFPAETRKPLHGCFPTSVFPPTRGD